MITFDCKFCSFVEEYEDFVAPRLCPECGGRCYTLRFGHKVKENTVNIDGTSRGAERYSHSMGCQPHEVAKFEKLYPGSKYTPDGRLVIKNRQHKRQEMKRRGYDELD